MIVRQAKLRVASILAFYSYVLPWQAPAQISDVKRIYVEPFTVKDGTGKLRDDVIAQLRKVKTLTVVPDQSKADAILSGDGEIWVRGYQSLNPRSGRLPFDGTPVYSGFLSVELRDMRGDTLWSYLVRQGAGSTNLLKDLSKQVAKHLTDALAPDNQPPKPHE